NPAQNVIRLRANSGSSTYHSMQVSFDKRLSRGFSAGLYYTWSWNTGRSGIFHQWRAQCFVSESVEHERGKPTHRRWLKICFLSQRAAARPASLAPLEICSAPTERSGGGALD
ncbi:MAG: hypothetical protein M3495_11950, partial [Pseudomonadota bacterium]|nr:hypothetical protein [Pseudomonadota bacterium]